MRCYNVHALSIPSSFCLRCASSACSFLASSWASSSSDDDEELWSDTKITKESISKHFASNVNINDILEKGHESNVRSGSVSCSSKENNRSDNKVAQSNETELIITNCTNSHGRIREGVEC